MSPDLLQYRQSFEPRNIFDLLPRAILEQMIKGFFYRLKSGVTLLYAERSPASGQWVVSQDRVEAFDYDGEEDRQCFNAVCWGYRKRVGDENCKAWDYHIAEAYVRGEMQTVQPYECWLGMDDLAYPLRIGGEVCAILQAGQIMPNDDERVLQIEENLRKYGGDLVDLALAAEPCRERQKQWRGQPNFLSKRISELVAFGKMLQEILNQQYDAKKTLAIRDIVQQSSESLAALNLSQAARWWVDASALLASFCKLVRLKSIQVYTREKARFVCRVPITEGDAQPARVPARDIVPTIPPDRLISADPGVQAASLVQLAGVAPGNVMMYRSDTQVEGAALSTLIVMHGVISEPYQSLVEDFCRVVSQRADFASLVFHLRDTQEQYKITVGQVAHDFRTPLQVLTMDLDEVSRLPAVASDPGMANRISESLMRAETAREHTFRLQRTAIARPAPVDLTALLGRVMNDLMPLARKHPCNLLRTGQWPGSLVVHGNEYELRRAFTNLVDNAIKYSFTSRASATGQSLYSVTVSLDEDKGMARVRISNYGVGIPAIQLERVMEIGQRALVPDTHYTRHGTGWGLSIVKEVLENHGGYLELTSKPQDDAPRNQEANFHRYETVATAYLPVRARSER